MSRHVAQTESMKPSKGVVAFFAILLILIVSAATGWGW